MTSDADTNLYRIAPHIREGYYTDKEQDYLMIGLSRNTHIPFSCAPPPFFSSPHFFSFKKKSKVFNPHIRTIGKSVVDIKFQFAPSDQAPSLHKLKKEGLTQSTRADWRENLCRKKAQNRRNTLCIARFCNAFVGQIGRQDVRIFIRKYLFFACTV